MGAIQQINSNEKSPFLRILELQVKAKEENVGQVLEKVIDETKAELLIVTPRSILHHEIDANRIVQCNVLKTYNAINVLSEGTWFDARR